MRRVSDAVADLIQENAVLNEGFQNHLLNLSQVARYIKPQVEARTKKEVKESAILMSLSRLQRANEQGNRLRGADVQIDNLIIHSNLVIASYRKALNLHKSVNQLYTEIQSKGLYITITEGIEAVTIIISKDQAELLSALIKQPWDSYRDNIASLGIAFSKSYIQVPGLFYFLFQQLYFQNINVVEIASTATELIFYLDQEDVHLAFQTFYNRFAKR